MRKFTCGVYKFVCTETGKVYVGSSVKIESRRQCHIAALRAGRHHSALFQRAWNKYGESAFVFSIIEECEKVDLLAQEQFYIDSLNACDPAAGFNIYPNARSALGSKKTPAQIKKMSDRMRTPEQISERVERNRNASEEWREKTRQANRMRVWTAEVRLEQSRKVAAIYADETVKTAHRAKIVAAMNDPVIRKKISVAAKARPVLLGEDHPLFGRVLSAEHRAKLSASNIGSWSPQRRLEQRNRKLGSRHSEETKEKMRASAIARWRK